MTLDSRIFGSVIIWAEEIFPVRHQVPLESVVLEVVSSVLSVVLEVVSSVLSVVLEGGV